MAKKIEAPITANVWKLLKKEGEFISEGELIAILESMKMEIPVESPYNGKIAKLYIQEGGTVTEGDIIAEID